MSEKWTFSKEENLFSANAYPATTTRQEEIPGPSNTKTSNYPSHPSSSSRLGQQESLRNYATLLPYQNYTSNDNAFHYGYQNNFHRQVCDIPGSSSKIQRSSFIQNNSINEDQYSNEKALLEEETSQSLYYSYPNNHQQNTIPTSESLPLPYSFHSTPNYNQMSTTSAKQLTTSRYYEPRQLNSAPRQRLTDIEKDSNKKASNRKASAKIRSRAKEVEQNYEKNDQLILQMKDEIIDGKDPMQVVKDIFKQYKFLPSKKTQQLEDDITSGVNTVEEPDKNNKVISYNLGMPRKDRSCSWSGRPLWMEVAESKRIYVPHKLVETRLYLSSIVCHYCKNSFTGLISRGVKCQTCNCTYHKNCGHYIDNKCQVDAKDFWLETTTIQSKQKEVKWTQKLASKLFNKKASKNKQTTE